MIDKYLVQECEIIEVTRDEYSSYVFSVAATEPCRFRYIPTMRRGTNGEVNDADSLIHLRADTAVRIGSIIRYEGVFYQVERLWKARRLGSSTVNFVKAEVKVNDIAIS
jgi:hypothetical protein